MFKVQLKTLIDFSNEDVSNGVLVIPEGVETIKHINDFSCSKKIKKVVLPKSLKSIEEYAFNTEVFNDLEEIEFNEGLTNIASYAFFNNKNIKEISLPDSVKNIEDNAFNGCVNLRSVSLPKSLKVLKDSVFFECRKLENIVFPLELEEIHKNTFFNCNLKGTLNLPITLKFIEDNSFDYNKGVKIELDRKKLESENRIIVIKKSDNPPIKIEELDNKIIVKYNIENNTQYDANTLASYFYIFGNTKKLNELFKNEKNLNISHKLIFALHNSIKNNEKIEMAYFNHLLHQHSSKIKNIDVFGYNLGLFKEPVMEKRISKSGRVVEEKVNYAHKAYEFLRNVDINQFGLPYFDNFNKCEFKPEFAKFLLDKNNISKILEMEKISPGFISRCYNHFEEVQLTNTSNKGNQRQLSPTFEKFINYFNENKFENVGEFEDLSKFIGKYYNSQETFEMAKKIITLQKENKISNNITNANIIEEKTDKIEEHKKSIFKNAVDIFKNLVKLSNSEFTYEFLDKHDYLNLVLGKLCSCCAHIEGAGEGIATLSMLHPDFQNLIIRDENNVIVAKSTLYINREECYGVFNNVEINTLVDKYDFDNIYKKYIQAVKDFVKVYNVENPDKKLKQINVGMNNNDLAMQIIKHHKRTKALNFVNVADYSLSVSYYKGDAHSNQFVLYKAEKDKKKHKDNEKE